MTISIYTRPNSSRLGEYALKVAVKVMDYYQETYGIDFPLPKCDLIAIPDFSSGAMENVCVSLLLSTHHFVEAPVMHPPP